MPIGRDSGHPPEYLRALERYRAGRLREALEACIGHLGGASPPYPPTLVLLAQVLYDSGHYVESARELERALGMDASDAGAWLALAHALVKLGRSQDAIVAANKAISISPLNAEINAISAGATLLAGDVDAALAAAGRATQLDPGAAPGWHALAMALHAHGRVADAREAAQRALALDPQDVRYAGFAAQLDAESDDLPAAAARLTHALARHPGNFALLMEKAWVATRAHDLPAAIDAYARALSARPSDGAALSQLVFCKKQLLDWAGLGGLQQRMREGVTAKTPSLTPFSFLSDGSTRAEQKQCAATWAAGFTASPVPATHPARATGAAPRRLRVGYLSGDFYEHPTSVLLAGVLEQHARARFEVFAYSTGSDTASAMRTRIANAVEHFVDIRDHRPEPLATRMRADRLDVLVDLKGYTEGAPTAALALRPAPTQVHWLGYPGTLAAPFIDYLLVDRMVIPAAHQADYTEALAWLPHTYQPNDRSRLAAPAPARATLGIGQARTVLASFNAAWKFNAGVFDAWARILAAVPDSLLWLLARDVDDPLIANVHREFAERGIARQRVAFATRRAQPDYLALYEHVDLFLDTWPYNAHTTASDALWMRCPVVTWLGETFAGRVGASLLTAVGLRELVAGDVESYVALAIALANDAARRERLRQRLTAARTQSPLYDACAMARHVETAFERMVEQHLKGIRESFDVVAR